MVRHPSWYCIPRFEFWPQPNLTSIYLKTYDVLKEPLSVVMLTSARLPPYVKSFFFFLERPASDFSARLAALPWEFSMKSLPEV